MEKFIGSIEHTLAPELVEKLKADDAKKKAAEWKEFEENLPFNAKEITEAFRELYELYDEGLVKWMANLFDPDICVCNEVYGKAECEHHPLCGTAGFHYTHSARDTVGYMPNIEAMHSALNFTVTSGFTDNYLNNMGDISVTEFDFIRENDVVKINITFKKDGVETEMEAEGNGSLSAVNSALRAYTGEEYTLQVFTQHSMQGQGSQSVAASYIGLYKENGEMYWGAGTDTDVMRASTNALLSAYHNMTKGR